MTRCQCKFGLINVVHHVNNIKKTFYSSILCSACLMYSVAQSHPALCNPMDCSLPGSSVQGFFRHKYWSGLPCPPPGNLPSPGIKPRSSSLQADSLPSEPPQKPKNTGVGNLSLLQGLFSTQGWNQGLLLCRRILLPAELPVKPICLVVGAK